MPRFKNRRSAIKRRRPPSGRVASTTRGATRMPSARTNSRCGTANFFRWMSIRPSTMSRLRWRTRLMSTDAPSIRTPYDAARLTRSATSALRITFLLGRQATLGHAPQLAPARSRRRGRPCRARSHARYLPASPPPRTTFSMCYGLIHGGAHKTCRNESGFHDSSQGTGETSGPERRRFFRRKVISITSARSDTRRSNTRGQSRQARRDCETGAAPSAAHRSAPCRTTSGRLTRDCSP